MSLAKSNFYSVMALVLLCAAAFGSPAHGAIECLWTCPPPEEPVDASIDASPAIADADGDGRQEIFIATTYGHVMALDSTGKEKWKTYVGDVLFLAPSVADITGDGKLEVIVGGRRERFVCLDAATGAELWGWQHSGSVEWGTTAAVVADMDGDGVGEVVAGDANGLVVCLEGDGSERWRYEGTHGWTLCPAVGDLDNDGALEVLLGGTEIPLVCLDNSGAEKWRFGESGRGASPVLADLDGDADLEIITGIGRALCVIDHSGNVVWKCPMSGRLDAAISVGDADQDGAPEIYAADLSGELAKLTAEGKTLWERNVGGRVRRSPSIGDIDGDGIIEILVAGYSNAIHVFRPDGTLKTVVPLGEAANGTATLADLEGEGSLSIICPAAWQGMKAFRWEGAPKAGAVLWPEYRFNTARTAAYAPPAAAGRGVRISAIDYGPCHVGVNTFSVRVENPDKRRLAVRLSVAFGADEPCVSLLQSDAEAITRELPYTVSGTRALDIHFACRVDTDEGEPVLLARAEHSEYVAPFQRELMDILRSLDRLDAATAALPDPGFIRERLDAFRFRLPGCRERTNLAGSMNAEELGTLQRDVAALWEESTQLAQLIEGLQAASDGSIPPVLMSGANPWAPFGGMREITEQRLSPAAIDVEAFAGEYENGALNVYNLTHAPLSFRVALSSFSRVGVEDETEVAASEVATLREVLDIPTQDDDLSADAIPLLNQGDVLTVSGWNGRQLWLEVNTKALVAGEWRASLSLRSLEPKPRELIIPVNVTVWEDAVPEEQPVTLCHWGYVHRSVLSNQPEAALKDQVEHGTNVFVGTFAPEASFDEAGEIVDEIDFTAHDAYVQAYVPHGTILFCGYQSALKGPGGHMGDAYKKAYVAWLRAWVEHLKEIGVGYEDYALYPIDEPGLKDGLVEMFLHYATLAREADPNVRIYTDPVKRITMDELKAMAPYVDIWCPNAGSFLKFDCADKLAFIKAQQKPVWTYECSGNAKHQSPLGYYRALAWLAWHRGLSGIGYWTYCTSSDDPWFRPKGKAEYLLIYQGRGVVPSKRWKAIRDGLEDYSILHALREAADAAAQSGACPESVAAAKALLQEDAWAVAQFCGIDDDDTLPGPGGLAEVRQVADRRWEKIQSTRRQIAELLGELRTP